MSNSLQPITPEALREQLRTGLVGFYFVKKDGTLRECKATVNLNHIPADQHPQGVRPSPDSVVTFWDLLAGGWRSAKTDTQFFLKP